MQNSTSKKSFSVQLAEANNTVQAKGLVLSRWDKSICKADKSRFKALCAKDGFWFSLGEICLELLKQSGGKKTDSALLKDANLHTVAKQRRNEAMKFVKNFKVIEDNKLIADHASMTNLLKAVDKIINPKVEKEPKVPVEPKAPVLAVEDKSSNEPKAPMSPSDIALEALVQCEVNKVQVKDFMLALKEQLEMLDKAAA
jgi:hypothetical protein|tara:strand:- start:284 stop:880 length:597 start_codon:yes stop_codon:yes gene_type:complete